MSDLLSTVNIAWYGAVVATLSFGFTVFRWTRERPRLQIHIAPKIYLRDGGFSKIEKTEHGEVGYPHEYFHVEVRNVGARQTTIMRVTATTRKMAWEYLWPPRTTFGGEMGYDGFTPHSGKALPHVIGPGEVWSCRVRKDAIDGLRQGGRPKLELSAICWKRPQFYRFPLENTPTRLPNSGR